MHPNTHKLLHDLSRLDHLEQQVAALQATGTELVLDKRILIRRIEAATALCNQIADTTIFTGADDTTSLCRRLEQIESQFIQLRHTLNPPPAEIND